MTDILDYKVDAIQSTVFDQVDQQRLSVLNTPPPEKKKDKEANYVDIITLISSVTAPTEIDYQLVSDFFLTYRSFISPVSLLKLLLLRIDWCLACISDEAHEQRQNTGKLTLVRCFVVIRHWLLNYFTEDFISSEELRSLFIERVNKIHHEEHFVQRVVGNLKKTWTECCNKSWDESVTSNDYYAFEIKLGPQSTRNKRLSMLALSQQNDPVTRNFVMLSTYDKSMQHKLPIPIPSLSAKRKPNLFLNPKNSNLRLSMLAQTSPTSAYMTIPPFSISSRSPTSPMSPRSPKDPLYIPLLSTLDPKTRNLIRDESKFPKNPNLTKVLPPTPVKKMEFVVPLPPPTKPQPKGLRPLIDHWLRTFHSHTQDKNKQKTAPYVEKFMASVVSIAKPTTEELERLAQGKFDILSARSIDELEHLVRFHNVILSRHGSLAQNNTNARASFSFTIPGSKEDVKNVSHIDNMNICETISNISRSVVSFQQQLENQAKHKSYISYDSVYTNDAEKHHDTIQPDDAPLKKKPSIENLRSRTYGSDHDQDISRDGDDEKFEFEQEDDKATLETFPTSILSESTPNNGRSSATLEKSAEKETCNVLTDIKFMSVSAERLNASDSDSDEDDEIAQPVEAQLEHEECDESDSDFDDELEKSDLVKASEELSPQSEVEEASVLEAPEPSAQAEAVEADLATSVAPASESKEGPAILNDSGAFADDEESPLDTSSPSNIENISPERFSKASTIISSEFHDSHEDSSLLEKEGSDYDDIESLVSTYEVDENVDDIEPPEIETSVNHSDMMAVDEPSTPTHEVGLISSTPQISPIKALQENHDFQMQSHGTEIPPPVPPKDNVKLDLNRIPSFTRISNTSISSRANVEEHRMSYLSKRSVRTHGTSASNNSIFSGHKTSHFVNVTVQHEVDEEEGRSEMLDISTPPANTTNGSFSLDTDSDDFQVPYPGVDSDAIAELAAISDESYQDDPIKAALDKLEGQYKKKPESVSSRMSSVNSSELKRQVQDLAIQSVPPRKRDSVVIDQRRKTKLFSLTPVQQKEVKYEESSSKILLELLLSHKITNDILKVTNADHHVSFILNFDSKTIAEQLTLIEKDALLEIDWKELVELNWESDQLVPINSWLELLVQNQDIQGVDLCVSRFNLTVNWIISEILLTKDLQLRKLTIQRFIHVAQKCKEMQNFSTLMQILLALGSDKVAKLKETWRRLEPGDILIFKNLEQISSPLKNFMNLRLELNKIKPSLGCVPFLGLYLSDLIFNKEKRNAHGDKVNFGKFKHTSRIVRSLIQCIQWSTLYRFEGDEEVLSKCLYIKALTEDEMNACMEQIC